MWRKHTDIETVERGKFPTIFSSSKPCRPNVITLELPTLCAYPSGVLNPCFFIHGYIFSGIVICMLQPQFPPQPVARLSFLLPFTFYLFSLYFILFSLVSFPSFFPSFPKSLGPAVLQTLCHFLPNSLVLTYILRDTIWQQRPV